MADKKTGKNEQRYILLKVIVMVKEGVREPLIKPLVKYVKHIKS